MDDIVKYGVRGKVVAHLHVVEFQKHGLPHAHILLILGEQDKPKTASDYDTIASTDIPDPQVNLRPVPTITKLMTHGPCGAHNPTAPFMHNGQCSKKFPKLFESVIVDSNDGHPRYQQHCTEDAIIHHRNADVAINNHRVVPYSP